jgi:hypothetical protein
MLTRFRELYFDFKEYYPIIVSENGNLDTNIYVSGVCEAIKTYF